MIFALETIGELIEKDKLVLLKPWIKKEEPSFNKDALNYSKCQAANLGFTYVPFTMQNVPVFNCQFFQPYSPYNNYFTSNSYETPIYNNNVNFQGKQGKGGFASGKGGEINCLNGYQGSSSLFAKKNLENDLKFQTDTPLTSDSSSCFNYKLLSTNAPVFYPQSNLNTFQSVDFQPNPSFEEDGQKLIAIYDIQIENDDKFKVTKRVIGMKGVNMKKILNTCKMRFNYLQSNDLIKIRLRGKGSGYKEGLNKKGKDN